MLTNLFKNKVTFICQKNECQADPHTLYKTKSKWIILLNVKL